MATPRALASRATPATARSTPRRSRVATSARTSGEDAACALEWAREAWAETMRAGPGTCVDATLGRGRDALTLLDLGADVVYGFDVEAAAIASARDAFEASGVDAGRVRVELRCHAEGLAWLESSGLAGAVACVAFNLGYLPGDDAATRARRARTRRATTTAALESAFRLTRVGGRVTVVAYVGHDGGADECEGVRECLAALSSRDWVVTERRVVNRRRAPALFVALRRA